MFLLISAFFFFNFQVTVTLKESSTEGEIIKDFLHNCGSEKIREKLKLYVVMLKEGKCLFLGVSKRPLNCNRKFTFKNKAKIICEALV